MNKQEFSRLPKAKPSFFYGYIVVAVSCIIMVATYGAYYSFGIFLKPVLTDFGWTRAMTSGAFSLATLLSGVLAIPAGRLTDKFGSRMVMTLVGLFLGLGYLLMSQIHSIWQLYFFYGVMIGIGMGGPFVSLLSTTARWFAKKRGLMTGIVLSGIGLGSLIVPPIANRFIADYDWRISYIILGVAVLVLVLPTAQLLRRDPTRVGQMPDGEEGMAEHQSQIVTTTVPFKKALGTCQLWMVSAMVFCFGFCVFAIMVHIVPHATDLGISTPIAASLLSIIGISSIVGRVGMGYVADRIGSRPVWIMGLIILAISLFGFMVAGEIWTLCTFTAVFGLAYGGCVSVESPLIAELFGLGSHGVILGLSGFFFTFGAAIGPLQAGYIFDVFFSYETAFLICGIIAILGLILAVLLKPLRS